MHHSYRNTNQSQVVQDKPIWHKYGVIVAFFVLFCASCGLSFYHHPSLGNEKEKLSDQVIFLPGFGKPLEKQFSGLLQVNEKGGTIFYWFFESRSKSTSSETPIILWLNGGPGASSMTGLFTEMGPYRIINDGKLKKHPESWTNLGHMIFFDQPVGTGYTSCIGSSDCFVSSQEEVAKQMHTALTLFFEKHPEYSTNPIIVAGESYAGKYIPYICHRIHQENTNTTRGKINLHGIAIGNGIMKPILQTRSVPDYSMALGLIDKKQYDEANKGIDKCEKLYKAGKLVEAFAVCQTVEDTINALGGKPFVYDIRETGNPFDDLTVKLHTYFNRPDVRESLNVKPNTQWKSIDGSSYGISQNAPLMVRHLMTDEILDIPNSIFKILLENYKFLFYAGNMDSSSCNNLGIARVIDQIRWKGQRDYLKAKRTTWSVDGRVVGLVKRSMNMSNVVITNCGHLVPTNQPKAALDMMNRFINNAYFN